MIKIADEYAGIITPDQVIWRYMDFAKFVSIIHNSALWFTRIDHLKDKYEGSIPIINRLIVKTKSEQWFPDNPERKKEFVRKQNFYLDNQRKYFFVNSWSMDSHESLALWKIYLNNSPYGLTIKSTINDLLESFKDASEECLIYPITYKTHHWEGKLTEQTIHKIATEKTKYYDFEKECRIVYKSEKRVKKSDFGILIRIKPALLIKEIFISPGAPSWFNTVVRNFVKIKEFELKVHVRDSGIEESIL